MAKAGGYSTTNSNSTIQDEDSEILDSNRAKLWPIFVGLTRIVAGLSAGVVLRFSPRKPLFYVCSVTVIISYISIASVSYHLEQLGEVKE